MAILLAATQTAVCPVMAVAQSTDVVEVTNGDRFTGEVRRLERDELAFRTPAAGTIAIIWTEVVSITSTVHFDVELSSGERYSGTIASPSPRLLVVQTASGATKPIELTAIIRMIPVGATVRARTTGGIDVGATFTTADGARAYTLAATATNRTHSYETDLSFDSWLQRRTNTDTLTRNDFELDVRRFLHRRWFAVAKFDVQEDHELDLDWRVVAGGGIGRRLVQSNAMLLSVEGGLDYDGERYSSEGSTDHSAELFAGVDWDYFSPVWATEAKVVTTTFISLERQRARLKLDAQMRKNMFWNMYWSVNLFEHFDSDPPGDRERSNFGVSLGLGWSF
jgi:hypothetical protein